MRKFILASFFVAACFLGFAGEAEEPAPNPETVTYFLIDASGSMKDRMTEAEKSVTDEVSKLALANADAPVSITYFRADTENDKSACSKPIEIPSAVSASSINIEEEPYRGGFGRDSSPLGTALQAAILDVGERSAHIYLLSDEEQTSGCGPDICSIAEIYLPNENIEVTRVPVGADSTDSDRLGCIDAFSSSTSKGTFIPSVNDGFQAARPSFDWEKGTPLERWLWLGIVLISVGAAVSFMIHNGSKALAYERQSEHVQQLRRMILLNEGDVDEHKAEILKLVKFSQPQAPISLISAISLAVYGIISVLLFLTISGNLCGLGELSNARRLAWFVLSSGFSNAFAILIITPIIFAFAQNWRFDQAKRNFSIVCDAIAEVQAQRRFEATNSLYDDLNAIRRQIKELSISTPWSKWATPSFLSYKRRPKYEESDLKNLEEVKRKLREIAQGPAPVRAEETYASLAKKIEEREPLIPKWPRTSWNLDALIDYLDKSGKLGTSAELWRGLSKSIGSSDTPRIKSYLGKIAELA